MKKNNYNLIIFKSIIYSLNNAFVIIILSTRFYTNSSPVNRKIKLNIYIIHKINIVVIFRLIVVHTAFNTFTYILYPPESFYIFEIDTAKIVLYFTSHILALALLSSYFTCFTSCNKVQHFFYANFLVKKNKQLITTDANNKIRFSALAYFIAFFIELLIFFALRHTLRNRQTFLKRIT